MDAKGQPFLVGIIALLLMAASPLLTIWSLNELFHLKIEYTFINWFAMFWLGIWVGILVNTKRS